MKEIKAFIKPFKVMDVFHNLKEAGFPNLTVSKAGGTGTLKSEEENSTEFSFTDNKGAKIEIVCNKNDVDKIVCIIAEHGRTGNPGDGIIYVSDVNQIYRVKDGLKNRE